MAQSISAAGECRFCEPPGMHLCGVQAIEIGCVADDDGGGGSDGGDGGWLYSMPPGISDGWLFSIRDRRYTVLDDGNVKSLMSSEIVSSDALDQSFIEQPLLIEIAPPESPADAERMRESLEAMRGDIELLRGSLLRSEQRDINSWAYRQSIDSYHDAIEFYKSYSRQ